MSSPVSIGLTAEQLSTFHKDGYLVLEDFFAPSEADRMKAHIDTLLDGFDMSTHPRTIFRTAAAGSQTAAVALEAEDANKYFLDSADKVHFFFEEKAFNDKGELSVAKNRAINKIGHQLHVHDAEFAAFTNTAKIKAVTKSIGMTEPVVLQSMVICKQPRVGGEVHPHRDSTFLYTEPSTATGLWFAFEDCTATNGCLSFVPGSHKDGANTKRFGRKDDAAKAPLRSSVNNADYDASKPASEQGPNNSHVELIFTGEDKATYPPEAFKPAEVKKGTLVLIHGEVVHSSTSNLSDKSRYIYTFHLIDNHGTTYPKENWLQSDKKFPRLLQ